MEVVRWIGLDILLEGHGLDLPALALLLTKLSGRRVSARALGPWRAPGDGPPLPWAQWVALALGEPLPRLYGYEGDLSSFLTRV